MPASGDLLGVELDLEVLRVAHGGVFVASHEGRVVFVPDVLPGEIAHVRITEDRHGGFLRAETLGVESPSEHRRQHVWAAAAIDRVPEERAGGAEFGHIAPAEQWSLKRAVLRDALVRVGRMTEQDVDRALPEVVPVEGRPDGTGWRTRIRLHVGAGGRVGPYAARSRSVVPVDDLPLAVPGLTAIAPARSSGRRGSAVDLVAPSTAGPLVLSRDSGPIVERVGDREFRLEAGGFWQVHPAAAATLTAAVRRAIDPARFDERADNLDLYGGVGLFAAAIGAVGGARARVATVESDGRATRHAAANLADIGGAIAVTAPVEQFLRQHIAGRRERGASGATVVLDPPRSGAGIEVVDRLVALGPAQLVYVACDPVAFARDAGRLVSNGYGMRSLEAFDLFPNTHHFECVAVFTP